MDEKTLALTVCSFCGRQPQEVGTILVTDHANICDDCVSGIHTLMRENSTPEKTPKVIVLH